MSTLAPEAPTTTGGDAGAAPSTVTGYTEPGDHDRFAHYVPRDDLNAALLTGERVTALCGHRWLAVRDPQAFPVCSDCKRIYERLEAGDDFEDDPRVGR